MILFFFNYTNVRVIIKIYIYNSIEWIFCQYFENSFPLHKSLILSSHGNLKKKKNIFYEKNYILLYVLNFKNHAYILKTELNSILFVFHDS